MSARGGVLRRFWALIGKILWFFLRIVLKIIATLGGRWARKRIEQHDRKVKHEKRRDKVLRR